MSSMEITSERVCYVHCNFCNTILAVSVPCSSMLTVVTVRCGHCGNLLSVNMGALVHTAHLQDLQKQQSHVESAAGKEDVASSSKCDRFATFDSVEHEQPRMPPIRPLRKEPSAGTLSHISIDKFKSLIPQGSNLSPEKRQRVPSAYNRFIKEEIQRIKASNPDISHREAFSTAAKNWAHFPHIHFGLKPDNGNNKQVAKADVHAAVAGEGPQKSLPFY